MTKYDHIVVGSGISGLTATLLLAMTGQEVLLLEKAPHIGGSLARFRRKGVPFDTGFHFTGGFHTDGILYDMLSALGIRDFVRPLFLPEDHAHRFIFESKGVAFDLPSGTARIRQKLRESFPCEEQAIERYFDRVEDVCNRTSSMRLRSISVSPLPLDEDYVSLQSVLDDLTDDRVLKAIFGGFSMCYGVKPEEISFANHSRMCQGMYESVARVEDGGEAFIRAFQERFNKLAVEIRTGTWIDRCEDIEENNVRRFVLNDGSEVTAKTCVFTIHPKEVLAALPGDHLSKAFKERVSSFESSSGFFSVFGTLDKGNDDDLDSTIVSLFPSVDINALLDPDLEGDSALVLIKGIEDVEGKKTEVVTAFEPSFPDHVHEWVDSRRGHRPQGYKDYKAAKTARILERMGEYSDEYKERFTMLDSASILTFRDYLFSPDGSAYGVKQKMGQFNLLGKLPLRNLFASGQSSVLPGLVGAMASSFIVCRALLGKDEFGRLIGV